MNQKEEFDWEKVLGSVNLDPDYSTDAKAQHRAIENIAADQSNLRRQIFELSQQLNAEVEKFRPIAIAAQQDNRDVTHYPEFKIIADLNQQIEELRERYNESFKEMQQFGEDDRLD